MSGKSLLTGNVWKMSVVCMEKIVFFVTFLFNFIFGKMKKFFKKNSEIFAFSRMINSQLINFEEDQKVIEDKTFFSPIGPLDQSICVEYEGFL
jgi:hypothetical protein